MISIWDRAVFITTSSIPQEHQRYQRKSVISFLGCYSSLRTLRVNLLALLGMGSDGYNPHMSLMYGTYAATTLAVISNAIAIPDIPTKIARLDLVPITPDPNEWESIYSLYLIPSQQA